MRFVLALVLMSLPVSATEFAALVGHGGPVMAVAVQDDRVLTASFDYSVGFWAGTDAAPTWLEGHRAAVNTVVFLPGNRAVSGGDDFQVILWDLGSGVALATMSGHQGKVMQVRASADGMMIASASWDGTIRLWSVNGEALRVLSGHDGNVNDIAFSPDGTRLYSASYDGTLVEWDVASGDRLRILARHGFGINELVVNNSGEWIAYGALDGGTRVLRLSDTAVLADLTLDRRPILAMDLSPDDSRLAVGDGEGYIMVVETAGWTIENDFHAARNGPVWALAFTSDGQGLVAGGLSDAAYIWPLDAGAEEPRMAELKRQFHSDPATLENGERQFLRKCSVCHTLEPDTARRAGPSLYGLFGRQAGSYAGYAYSPAMRDSGIIWTAETIDKLFDLGPDHYTPGSKMPMQRITRAQDRADLIGFLQRETATE